MKIVIFSDSHGHTANMFEAADMHRDADCFIHLGDGRRDADLLQTRMEKSVLSVYGNCDGLFLHPSAEPPFTVADFDSVKVFLCHGHTYSTPDNILLSAEEKGADIAMFGHIHRPIREYIPSEGENGRPIWLFNPGSISKPREGKPSFGILEIRKNHSGKNDILLSHGYIGI